MTHETTSLRFLERAARAGSLLNKTGTVAYVKGTLPDFINHKPASLAHLSVKAPHEAFIASLIASNKRTPTAHCENCGGDGGWPGDHGRWDVCPACEGTGEVLSSERTLIDLDDLDTINRDKPLENFDADA